VHGVAWVASRRRRRRGDREAAGGEEEEETGRLQGAKKRRRGGKLTVSPCTRDYLRVCEGCEPARLPARLRAASVAGLLE
jgi:hypothetical protein